MFVCIALYKITKRMDVIMHNSNTVDGYKIPINSSQFKSGE